MARLPLHYLGSPILRECSTPVGTITDEVRKLVRNLYDTMYANQGVGLAANQVGIAQRIAVVDAEDRRLTLINPKVVDQSGEERAEEGCLSIPELFGDVDRPARIVVETDTLEGARERHELQGLPARAVQHEIDHLDGILFIDHLSPFKRQMLLRKWKKLRRGETGHVEQLVEARTSG